MQSSQFYKYTTWAMVLLNLVLLGILIAGIPPSGDRMRAIDSLKLNGTQHDAFLASAKKHELLMTELVEKQRDLLRPYFQQLIKENEKVDKLQLFAQLKQLESQKLQSTYQHFEEIKNILTEEQMADFELFMNRMLEKILLEREKKPRPPKEF